jgi:hypothetical protein
MTFFHSCRRFVLKTGKWEELQVQQVKHCAGSVVWCGVNNCISIFTLCLMKSKIFFDTVKKDQMVYFSE